MLLLCLKIFAARIVDVSLGTIRTVYFVKGKTIEPFIIAFFEVLVWFLVAKEALATDGNIVLIAVSYAGGYATGTFIGSKISNTFIRSKVAVQTVVNKENDKLIKEIRKKGYGVSVIKLDNVYDSNKKIMLYIEINNNKIKELTNIIKEYDDKAFITINETKVVQNGLIK